MFVPVVVAKSSDIPIKTIFEYICLIMINTASVAHTVIITVRGDICEMSPRSALPAFFLGSIRNAIAIDEANTVAVMASKGSFVFCCKSHMIAVPKTKKSKAPREMSKP